MWPGRVPGASSSVSLLQGGSQLCSCSASPCTEGPLPCYCNRGSLNHLWARWGNCRAAVPWSPRGQWPEAVTSEQTEPCLSGSSVLEHCSSLCKGWSPGGDAFLCLGCQQCCTRTVLISAGHIPAWCRARAGPCLLPGEVQGFPPESLLCLRGANHSGLGEAQHLVGGGGCKAASGNVSSLLRCL